MKKDLLDRYKGCFVGLATGDALGVPLEFSKRDSHPIVTEMIGNGPFHLNPGEWTDDTSMALCIANSLIEKNGFDPSDQLDKYWKWVQEGYMSSTGKLFDIGEQTSNAVCEYIKNGNVYSRLGQESSCGNGSIMRLAPISLYYYRSDDLYEFSKKSSMTTHPHFKCLDSCVLLSYIISKCLDGCDKQEILSENYKGPMLVDGLVWDIASGSYKNKTRDQIKSTGYVIDTLEAAIWSFHTTDSFEEGCIKAVNLGIDSDTIGAVYGQIAGAYYGYENIPDKWKSKLVNLQMLIETSEKLFRIK